MEIEIEKLQQASNQIFDHIRLNLQIDKIVVEKDFYWNVPDCAWTDMNVDPAQLDIGQLSDDLMFLMATLENKEQSTPLMFIHLAPLIRYIANRSVE